MPSPVEGGGLTHQVKKEPLERGEIVNNIDLYEGKSNVFIQFVKIGHKGKGLILLLNMH